MPDATDHDQLFKNVIREFLPDFLTLCFPELAASHDLSAVSWLNSELFPNPPDGPKHVLDLVAELRTLGGDASTLALIHVEVESAESATDIESRLPDYYHYLRRTQKKPVRPVVVFLRLGFQGLGTRVIHDPPVGRAVATYRYDYVGRRALPAADYLRGMSLLGVALSARMRARNDDRMPFGEEAIQRIGESELTDGKKALLADCVEAYIDIPDEEMKAFRDILEKNATGRVPQMHKTRVQIAEEKAAERAAVTERKASVLKALRVRVRDVPADIAEKVGRDDRSGRARQPVRRRVQGGFLRPIPLRRRLVTHP